MDKTKDVIISDSLEGIGTDAFGDYLAHAICIGGSCRFMFNGKDYELHEGDLMIVRKGKLVENIEPSSDFRVKTVYIKPSYVEICTPNTNYGIKGQLSLFLNPIMSLDREQMTRCRIDFDSVEYCLEHTEHHFHSQMKINVIQRLILNFFDFHSHIYGESPISTQNASVMSRFLNMLENGSYRRNREVSYYADVLCVTPKYLSEISKKVSGFTANYWINRYTMLDISRLLRDKSLTFVQISDMFGFSSPAYFSRYVQHNLGVNPTEYRE